MYYEIVFPRFINSQSDCFQTRSILVQTMNLTCLDACVYLSRNDFPAGARTSDRAKEETKSSSSDRKGMISA